MDGGGEAGQCGGELPKFRPWTAAAWLFVRPFAHPSVRLFYLAAIHCQRDIRCKAFSIFTTFP